MGLPLRRLKRLGWVFVTRPAEAETRNLSPWTVRAEERLRLARCINQGLDCAENPTHPTSHERKQQPAERLSFHAKSARITLN